MQFTTRRRRQAPAVIIISLIDILIVLLIFMMVTTTFRRQPAIKLTLPESKQAKPGADEATLLVSVDRQEPHLYLNKRPITADRLQIELKEAAAKNTRLALSVAVDAQAPFQQFVKVTDAAEAAGIKEVKIQSRAAGAR